MARIRSVKPEFFTSEVIAALPLSARLTFVGLWTHVDDNGVCLDNERLITAAVWPLEDDPTEILRRTREDLQRLQESRLVIRYVAPDGKRLLFVTHWDEHQRVSHPRKPRFARPTPEQCKQPHEWTTAEATPVGLGQSSGETPEDCVKAPETFRPEQGAGSREQGETSPAPDEPVLDADPTDEAADEDETLFEPPDGYPAALPSTAPKRVWQAADIDADPNFAAFWSAYPRKTDKGHARKAWLTALRRGADPEGITKSAKRFRDDPNRNRDVRYNPHPTTWLNGERYNDEASADPEPAHNSSAWWNN